MKVICRNNAKLELSRSKALAFGMFAGMLGDDEDDEGAPPIVPVPYDSSEIKDAFGFLDDEGEIVASNVDGFVDRVVNRSRGLPSRDVVEKMLRPVRFMNFADYNAYATLRLVHYMLTHKSLGEDVGMSAVHYARDKSNNEDHMVAEIRPWLMHKIRSLQAQLGAFFNEKYDALRGVGVQNARLWNASLDMRDVPSRAVVDGKMDLRPGHMWPWTSESNSNYLSDVFADVVTVLAYANTIQHNAWVAAGNPSEEMYEEAYQMQAARIQSFVESVGCAGKWAMVCDAALGMRCYVAGDGERRANVRYVDVDTAGAPTEADIRRYLDSADALDESIADWMHEFEMALWTAARDDMRDDKPILYWGDNAGAQWDTMFEREELDVVYITPWGHTYFRYDS